MKNYTDLNELWDTQQIRWREWHQALRAQALRLRQEVETGISAPLQPWSEPRSTEQRRYVEVIDLSDERTRLRGSLPDNAITDDGELIFGLSITFEKAPNTFPKQIVHVPIAVRFSESQPQFGFYDTQCKTLESHTTWETDLTVFVEALLRRVEDYLRVDPFAGPRKKSAIGFL